MTRELYYEMCYTLDMEPTLADIPVEYEDFPIEVQQAIQLYSTLQDNWDSMSGTYMGKSWLGLKDLLEIYDIPVEDRKDVLQWIRQMDATRSRVISESKPKPAKK